MKKAIIIGATSGMGEATAKLLHRRGWAVGLMGRRTERLQQIAAELGERVFIQDVDVTHEDADIKLMSLIDMMDGVDLIFNVSGIGKQNRDLDVEIEMSTVKTNVEGFTRMVTAAFNYFAQKGRGHIAILSSIAGTKGLGAAPAYSATKRFQNTYIQCLAQLAHMRKLDIKFTDIRPGFVDTDLLKGGSYPMLMDSQKVSEKIVKDLLKQKRKSVIDWRYAILVFFWRLIPDCIWEKLNIHN